MRVALVHDHLIQQGGAERVLEAMQAMWPTSPTYTLYYDKKNLKRDFGHRDIRPSFLQNLPFGKKIFRWLLPLMPLATETYDLHNYDVVISSASAFAKGILTPTNTLHICYCHTPTRYLWQDSASYIDELKTNSLIKKILPLILSQLRLWDKTAADRTDLFIANSKTVQKRIKKYYRRESTVIYPPVDIDKFTISSKEKTFFLAGGRLVAYKRFDLLLEAFSKIDKPLIIFGTGPAEKELKKRAPQNVTFVGRVSDEERARLFSEAIAFLHPQEEDFGLTAVESMATGRPVIAFAKGGAEETVVPNLTGLLFFEQTPAAIIEVIKSFNEADFSPEKIREHANKFSTARFRKELADFVNNAWQKYENRH